ncbi:aminotransferase class I/II-fold pyridoxal phosphate-dependent enzyme [Butyrivibrio fibrisolvens]|uniref:aminotransferase class I/II-fold pyridoxal phosphate-dependent enzyme n=1 Tax=Butyrivibrio fibrisolvens TaxID=831 RepID=UPI0003B4A9CD|nr:PLP-dependent transferase [Butyrivibrio fibrisolvens]
MGQLWDKLGDLSRSNMYPYHMPGHKRNAGCGMDTALFFDHDITEIDDFDNLHDARDIIMDCQKRANALYKAGETYFLVNGSTCGVLSAISAVTGDGDTILTARNCHKSLYHAAYLRNLKLEYLYPQRISGYDFCGAVKPEDIDAALKAGTSIKAVFITSPTYEGVYSDVRAIANIVHSYGAALIVDEAHGAHLGISDRISEGAIEGGADIVIHSLHKTLPSITQTALLHVNGTIVDRDRLKRFLRIYQTSSPSYLMMASIDDCITYMTANGNLWADSLMSYHDKIIDATRQLQHLEIPDDKIVNDPCKVVISCRNTSISGSQLYDLLRTRYALQPEMACETYVLMIITGMDTIEGIDRLIEAVEDIDRRLGFARDMRLKNDTLSTDTAPKAIKPLRDAWDSGFEEVFLESAVGRIAGDFVNLYPPGIPIIVPGEEISQDIVSTIRDSLSKGLNVQGISETGKIRVIT